MTVPALSTALTKSGGGPQWLAEDLQRIERLLLSSTSSSVHPLVGAAASHLLKAGGKRVRPALVILTSRSGEPGRDTSDLSAAAIELVHLATLYHDDVIDDTPTRRGVPTVHAKWGTHVAVLAGDFLFARGCALGADAGGEVPGILARAIGEVCEGQISETASLGDPLRTVDDHLDTIRRKTAALFRAGCELGAATAGATPAVRAALVRYGENLGMAFQIVDDLIDILGDHKVTGKVPGTDLKEGVLTLSVLLACRRSNKLSGDIARGCRDLEEALPVLHSTGALEDARAMALSYGTTALSALEVVPESDWRNALTTMVRGVLAQI